jgi:hypothetical protein
VYALMTVNLATRQSADYRKPYEQHRHQQALADRLSDAPPSSRRMSESSAKAHVSSTSFEEEFSSKIMESFKEIATCVIQLLCRGTILIPLLQSDEQGNA